MLKLLRFSEIFINISRIEDVEFWRKEFGIMTKFHFIYQIINSISFFEDRVFDSQRVFESKGKKISILLSKHHFTYERVDLMTIFHCSFEMDALTRLSLQKNIQILEAKINVQEPIYKNPRAHVQAIKEVMYEDFCSELQRIIRKCGDEYELGFSIDGKIKSSEYIEKLKKVMLKLVSA